MKLKPWYNVAVPREDLRAGEALDAAEFAVHLDQVHNRKGFELYWNSEEFFARTYLTKNLLDLAAEVVRRLSGKKTATSAVFNMTTQFGGGKTHALTLLYHLAQRGAESSAWFGVEDIHKRAKVDHIPKAKTAVFVGQRFDPRGGDDGTPYRRTPWAEIAWQLAYEEGVNLMTSFDKQGIAPGGDTLARLFALVNRPILILLDEVMNYVSRYRRTGLGSQVYHFIQNLSEEARSHDNVVLAVSLPGTEMEMTSDDVDDYRRLTKLLDRVGKAVIMAVETDTSEIIRRRLFEWEEKDISQGGRVMLTRDAINTCNAYAGWVQEHRKSLPSWFDIDNAAREFKATYPFHPTLFSVFERKWQSLPNFQRTRGVLRLLAMWVSIAYDEGFRGARQDPLIGLGTAPLDDPPFRASVFKQLNEEDLDIAVTTDICGSRNSHAIRLDEEAGETIKRSRLHRKAATTIFFESNGGQTKDYATIPEIRLAVGEPGFDVGNAETVVEALAPPDGACYYLDVVKNQYWFSKKANLTRVLSDRMAAVSGDPRIEEKVLEAIQKQFGKVSGVNCIPFPEKSNRIPNQPTLSIAILPPYQSFQEKDSTLQWVDTMTREHGTSSRTYKSAVIWAIAEGETLLMEAARKLLAWEMIEDERENLQLSDEQIKQLNRNLERARSDLKEGVWRVYNKVVMLDKNNQLRQVDLGRHNSSSAKNILTLILRELRKYGDVEDAISPNFLVRNWPPAFTEWSTKAVRDAFYASPQFPRLLDTSAIQDTIARGVRNGILAYVGKMGDGDYKPYYFNQSINVSDVEITEDMYIISGENAEAYLETRSKSESTEIDPLSEPKEKVPVGDQKIKSVEEPEPKSLDHPQPALYEHTPTSPTTSSKVEWRGEIPSQKWANFYLKVLTKFAARHDLKLTLNLEISSDEGITPHKIVEMKTALRDLGLDDDVEVQ